MAVRPVHWEEGMFLRPHHFQAAQKATFYEMQLSDQWNQHYNWGIRWIDLDPVNLANHRFVIRSLGARFTDGTLVEEENLPVLNLKQPMEQSKIIMVYLGVPLAKIGKNVGEEGSRYVVEREDREDENDGKNPQELHFRRLNLRLLWSSPDRPDHPGYLTIPLARIKKADRMEATPEIDEEFIPPVIACDAWKPLAFNILETIYDFLGTNLDKMEKRVKAHRLSFNSQALGDTEIFAKLRLLNEAYTYWGIFAFAKGLHPLQAYLELCRLAGQLAIFTKNLRAPGHFPKYDHDDLFHCFDEVKRYITLALKEEPPPLERDFEGFQKRMQVDLDDYWLQPGWQMFVRVFSDPILPSQECVDMLSKGGLPMKIGSSEEVEKLFVGRFNGLSFTHETSPPLRLRPGPEFTFFKLDTQSDKEQWNNVVKHKKLAIRFNVEAVSGQIHGEKGGVTVRWKGRPHTLGFTLCLIQPDLKSTSADR